MTRKTESDELSSEAQECHPCCGPSDDSYRGVWLEGIGEARLGKLLKLAKASTVAENEVSCARIQKCHAGLTALPYPADTKTVRSSGKIAVLSTR